MTSAPTERRVRITERSIRGRFHRHLLRLLRLLPLAALAAILVTGLRELPVSQPVTFRLEPIARKALTGRVEFTATCSKSAKAAVERQDPVAGLTLTFEGTRLPPTVEHTFQLPSGSYYFDISLVEHTTAGSFTLTSVRRAVNLEGHQTSIFVQSP